jgi:aryl-alcohol dehydrogenase-like predicted oxidoreductase
MGLFSASAETISVRRLGLGGFHAGAIEDADLAVDMIRHAVDCGFALLDNSWDYNDGESERRVGRALATGGYRDRVLVMTKVDSRSYDGVMRQFSESLERLAMSRIDLLQLHEVIRPGDGEDVVRRGGLRALAELRDQGVVGHIGITGHKEPHYMIDTIDRAAAAGVAIETAQMPINAADVRSHSFAKTALPACIERGVEVLGMKPLGGGRFVERGDLHAPDLLRWALSQPIAICITGCESLRDVDQALAVRDGFVPMSLEEQVVLELSAERLMHGRRFAEDYKTTALHDATIEHPEWLV